MSAEELRLPMPWGHVSAKAWGSPKDERVLVVHGILDNAGSFDRLIELLPQNFYFVCIDLPGHGFSSHFPFGIPLDYFNYILTVRRVLDCLKWDTCIYIGHSLGANMGLMFTAIYPERVKKLLCLDAMTSRPVQNEELIPIIRKIHDYASNIKEEETVAPRLHTEEEVMYMLMNLRMHALNVAAAAALMQRSVSKVGNKYKLNRDPRLNISLFPLLNNEQHISIIQHVKTPVTIILVTATLSGPKFQKHKLLTDVSSVNRDFTYAIVEGNHDVHNNHPERVAPHVSRFLGSIKSSL